MTEINEIPLYLQLVDTLKNEVIDQTKPNSKMLSEREIVRQYGVSRTTVRLALNELEITGAVYRQRGRGTFVANQASLRADLSKGYSFNEQMEAIGKLPTTEVLSLDTIQANAYFAKQLAVEPQTPIYKLKRLRIADGVPIMVERTYLPAQRFKGLTLDTLAHQRLYQLMETKYHVQMGVADEAFQAGLVSHRDAETLHIIQGTPCLNLTRTTCDAGGEIVEFTLSVARGDQFVYHVRHLSGNQSGRRE